MRGKLNARNGGERTDKERERGKRERAEERKRDENEERKWNTERLCAVISGKRRVANKSEQEETGKRQVP